MKNYFIILILSLLSISATAQVSRNFNKVKKPKYEIGGGFAYFNMPNYPGSKESTLRFIPFPLAIYRGEVFRADEDGTRARVINAGIFEFGFSGGFNFSIKESDNQVRSGMGDTGTLVGLGPALIFNLIKNKQQKLIAGIGLRANVEADSLTELKSRGWIIEPYIRYLYKPSSTSRFTILSSFNISYAGRRYHSFFYEVEARQATIDRPEYKAKHGLADATSFLGVTYDTRNNLSLFAGGLYSNLAISRNRKSPLLQEKHNLGFGVGLTWLFLQSDEKVD